MAKNHSNPIQLPLAIEGETVEIPLSQGYMTVVDAVDGDLALLSWTAQITRHGVVYARRNIYHRHGSRKQFLHRVILERELGRAIPSNLLTDHKDGNGLNNRRSNLRLATHRQNGANHKPSSNNTSGVTGVHWFKATQKWQAYIQYRNKRRGLGYYDDFDEAVAVRQRAEAEMFGDFAPAVSRGGLIE